MKSKTWEVFFASVFGSGAGGALALYFSDLYVWFSMFGFILGGFFGYIFFRIEEVVVASKDGYEEAKKVVVFSLLKEGWLKIKEDVKFLARKTMYVFIYSGLLSMTVYCCAYCIGLFLRIIDDHPSSIETVSTFSIVIALIGLVGTFFVTFFNRNFYKRDEDNLDFILSRCLKISLIYTAPLALYNAVIFIFFFFAIVGCGIYSLFKAIAVFVKHVLVSIYSKERTVAMLSACLGSVTAFILRDIFIGMAVGGALGVLQLKLITARIRKTELAGAE